MHNCVACAVAGLAQLAALGITPARKVLVLDSGDLRPAAATAGATAGGGARAAAASGGNLTATVMQAVPQGALRGGSIGGWRSSAKQEGLAVLSRCAAWLWLPWVGG